MTKYQEQQEMPKMAFETGIFIKMIICSLVGIVSFFVTFEWNGKSSILIDHVVSAFTTYTPALVNAYVLILLILGAFYPFVTKKWKVTKVNMVQYI